MIVLTNLRPIKSAKNSRVNFQSDLNRARKAPRAKNEKLESQFLNLRISELLSKLSDNERKEVESRFGLHCVDVSNKSQSKIAYLAEFRLKKMIPEEEFGNFLA